MIFTEYSITSARVSSRSGWRLAAIMKNYKLLKRKKACYSREKSSVECPISEWRPDTRGYF